MQAKTSVFFLVCMSFLRVILCGGNHLNATVFTWFNDARFFQETQSLILQKDQSNQS